MSCIVINVVFNKSDKCPARNTLILKENHLSRSITIKTAENQLVFYLEKGEDIKSLVTIEEEDGVAKVVKYIESIFVDNLKVFDFDDFDIRSYIINGEKKYKLENRKAIKIPTIF